jgi:hypothetical protein
VEGSQIAGIYVITVGSNFVTSKASCRPDLPSSPCTPRELGLGITEYDTAGSTLPLVGRRVLGEGVIWCVLFVAVLRRRGAQFQLFFVNPRLRLIHVRYLFEADERPAFQSCIQGDISSSQRNPQLGRRLDPYAPRETRPRGHRSRVVTLLWTRTLLTSTFTHCQLTPNIYSFYHNLGLCI